MGGEVALTAASEDPRVGAVVAEGATARTEADDTLLAEPNPIARANTWLQFQLVRLLARVPEPPALIDVIPRIRVPVLLIEGGGPREADYGPRYAAAAPVVTLWMIPESPHVGGLSTRPEEYRQRVLALFDAALG
jgi:pimeloyl-ACP methyl ester carboxylesterase